MRAELDVITITIHLGKDQEWPSAHEQRALADDIEHEFEVIDTGGPYRSGTWNFIMRERDHAAVVKRINEMICEHTGRVT